jgi:hypothetical protein
MLKLFIIISFIAAPFLPQQHINTIRPQLTQALNSSKTTDSLYNALSNYKEQTPVINSYIATLEALKAKHTWNPYNKIKYINDSEKTFANAVAADPHNIEVRFMRFSVEQNIPSFLGYNKNLQADREEIIDQLKKNRYGTADKELAINIIQFLLASKRCTPAENTYLKSKKVF